MYVPISILYSFPIPMTTTPSLPTMPTNTFPHQFKNSHCNIPHKYSLNCLVFPLARTDRWIRKRNKGRVECAISRKQELESPSRSHRCRGDREKRKFSLKKIRSTPFPTRENRKGNTTKKNKKVLYYTPTIAPTLL